MAILYRGLLPAKQVIKISNISNTSEIASSFRSFVDAMSNFKQIVIYFLELKLRNLEHPYIVQTKLFNQCFGKTNTSQKFVVKVTFTKSTRLPCALVRSLGLLYIGRFQLC